MKSLKLLNLIITVSVMLFMLSACETDVPSACPDANFAISVNNDSTDYIITADFEGIEELVYGWYVNDDLIETEDFDDDRNNHFDFTFVPGTYTVCIKAESTECGGSIEFCQEVTIESLKGNVCHEPEFEKDQISDHKYLFKANFPGMDSVNYTWYVDGDSIESEALDSERHHAFDYEFTPGVHKVCIIVQSDHCDELVYCREIHVEGPTCAVPEFRADHDGNYSYHFIAGTETEEDSVYTWFINGEEVENIENEYKHKLYWQFEPGIHTVCLVRHANDQCEVEEYCKTITVEPAIPNCVDLSYSTEQVEGGYSFTANFDKRDSVTYIWKVFINDDLQGSEVREAGCNDDHSFSWDFEPGVVYEVCLKQDGCNESIVCNTYSIE